jgi:hypothetical protein
MIRTPALVLAAALALTACKASASIKHVTPVANLQSYSTVAVRGAPTTSDPHLTRVLIEDTVMQLAQQCQFHRVLPIEHVTDGAPDLIVDLNIRRSFRGGTGLVQNENKATVEVLVVLSDGISQELLGTAWLNGESAAVMTNAQSPEYQAVGAVASQLGKVLAKSGCTGDRIARAPAEPSDQTSAAPEGGDPEPGSEAETLARAEALNDEGKRLFLSADMNGALGKFQEAAQLVPDPRFELNICLAYEALKRYDDAIATCEKVAAQTANPRVAAKAKERVAINQHLRQ